MDNRFTLPIVYSGASLELNVKLIRMGFIYQFHILVDGRTIVFEKDEEGNYRVIDTEVNGKQTDRNLLEAIIDKLHSLQEQ